MGHLSLLEGLILLALILFTIFFGAQALELSFAMEARV